VFMANAASLLLPGSNLTNLLVLRSDPRGGGAFALAMLPAWLAACTTTAVFVAIAFGVEGGGGEAQQAPPLRLGIGAAAAAAAAAIVLAMPDPALPVLAVGIAATTLRRLPPRLDVRALLGLFVVAVALGTVGRVWQAPAHLLDSSGVWAAAAIGAGASVLINNLPATVLFTARPAAHPDALLLGLDLGPNLAVTGSLSAVLWLQAARTVGARASIATYSRVGLLLVPVSLASSLAALAATSW